MRYTALGLAGLALVACSKPTPPAAANVAAAPAATTPAATPAAVTAAAASVSGVYKADGKAAALAVVSAHKGDPFDGTPITDLVFTAQSQASSTDPAMDAVFGNFGDAIVAHVENDGTVTGIEVLHSGLKNPKASVSISGPIKMVGYKNAGGQISGELTSDGPIDVFDDKVEIDLTFGVKAP